MRWLRVVAIAAVIMASASGLAIGQDKPLPAERNNYCLDEAIRWVKHRYGDDTEIRAAWIDKSGIQEKAVTGWRVLVWTNRCDDYFTMDFGFRTVAECTQPQYGEREHMMLMVGAHGDCRRLLPRMEHPR
jgi:hypothetical protein